MEALEGINHSQYIAVWKHLISFSVVEKAACAKGGEKIFYRLCFWTDIADEILLKVKFKAYMGVSSLGKTSEEIKCCLL